MGTDFCIFFVTFTFSVPTSHVSTTGKLEGVLDLVFSNDPDSIHSISVTKTELSDHDIVSCTLLNPELLLPS